MAKSSKKKNRKLRRQVRKTIGALFMASAIAVAAIPVQDVSALDYPATNDTTAKIKVLNYNNSAMASTDYESLSSYTNGYTSGITLDSTSMTANVESYLKSTVPLVPEQTKDGKNTPIYTTPDGMFQFAFVKPNANAANEVAIILGADVTQLPNNYLEIPDSVDAYKKYTANSTSSGYCAVNKEGEYLYYSAQTQKTDESGQPLYKVPTFNSGKGPDGEITEGQQIYEWPENRLTPKRDGSGAITGYVYSRQYQTQPTPIPDSSPDVTTPPSETVTEEYPAEPIMVESRTPCYWDDYSKWGSLPDSELYYWTNSSDTNIKLDDISKFTQTTVQNKQRLRDAQVQYIGRQYLTAGDNGDEWKIKGTVDDTAPNNGVFAGKGQIVTLKVGDHLLGIGDYAFYGCTGLNSVTLGNGLSTIGNYAFADCINLIECNMQINSQITAIGAYAFADCQALKSIVIPVNVRAICDYAFAGCSGMTDIDLCGNGQNVALNVIGYKAFADCTSLTSLTFPATYRDYEKGIIGGSDSAQKTGQGVAISCIEGCTSLQYIKVQNSDFTFVESAHDQKLSCNIGVFISKLPESFYFEGPESDSSQIHIMAKEHSAAFKYLDKDEYEKVLWCPETEYNDTTGDVKDGTGHQLTFVVDSSNRLINMEIPEECGIVEIPANIGPFGVETIGSNSFQNNCFLTKIKIPSTVKYIEANAFKGCHNLKNVIFSSPVNIVSIGSKAFDTQNVGLHKTGCENRDYQNGTPELSFTGEISPDCVPFQYAMDAGNNINVGSQPRTYITYYSGWPTNLTVRYNQDTDKNELIDYPKWEELANYAASWPKSSADSSLTPNPNAVTYPDLTDDYAKAAASAVQAYNDPNSRPTQDQMDIINSALNINLPAGIESIKHGIFSDIDLVEQLDYEEDKFTGPNTDITDLEDGQTAYNGKVYNYRNTKIESITMNTVEELEPYTFAGCESLTGFYMSGGDSIDDYVFYDCNKLTNVEVAPSVTELGTRPFGGCTSLTYVGFGDSSNFICENGIIFGLAGGAKNSIVECLEARGRNVGSYAVGPDELTGITSIAKEAFMNCAEIGRVDLSTSSIEEIPEGAFRGTTTMTEAIIPDTVGSVEKGSFWDSGVRLVRWWGNPAIIAQNAFRNYAQYNTPEGQVVKAITFQCLEGGTVDRYAKAALNPYINPEYGDVYLTYHVYFWDYPDYPSTAQKELFYQTDVKGGDDAVPPTETPAPKGGKIFRGWSDYTNISKDTDVYPSYDDDVFTVTFLCSACGQQLGEVQFIEAGKSAKAPEPHDHTEDMGISFTGWTPDYHDIEKNTTIFAGYSDSSNNMHTVTFYDEDGVTVIASYPVLDGATVYPPQAPVKSGKTFDGWKPSIFTNITRDSDFFASYIPSSGSGSGGSGSGGSGSGSSSKASASPSASPSATPGVTKYTVSVSGGSGSGQYAAGEIVAVNAYFMGSGQNFDKWTTSTAGVGFANANASSTTFTMPAANVAITATYTTGGGTPAANNSGGGSSSGGGNSGNNNGTSVQVTRPGISNEGLAGATVSGSTDNFIVKVTEDQNATNAVVAALQARYGDISRIKYLPMDISLYDSTGRTKIADTGGISVNLTLPIPDDLVQYAGNNKVAAITNGSMEDLNVRFTTVDGVSCVNFTATHFSPYVIYVDTANLTASTIDASPKTGDPIHPKWFLAMGMACISLILFFKRDKVAVKAKTA